MNLKAINVYVLMDVTYKHGHLWKRKLFCIYRVHELIQYQNNEYEAPIQNTRALS